MVKFREVIRANEGARATDRNFAAAEAKML
jgi:hypothetical protein